MFTPLRFVPWPHHSTHLTKLPRGHRLCPLWSDGSSALLQFIPSWLTLTAISWVLLPTGATATSTFSSRIPHSLVAALPPGSTAASSQRYVQKAA